MQSGSLAKNDGFFSDHTMQWVDFNVKDLFKSEKIVPLTLNSREFVLTNAKKSMLFKINLKS